MTAAAFNFIQATICWSFGLIFICSVVSIIDREIRAHRARKELKRWIAKINKQLKSFGTDEAN